MNIPKINLTSLFLSGKFIFTAPNKKTYQIKTINISRFNRPIDICKRYCTLDANNSCIEFIKECRADFYLIEVSSLGNMLDVLENSI